MKILKVSEIVKDILTKDVDSRDSDELLMKNVWRKQSTKILDHHYNFLDFSIDFVAGNFFKSESIRRSRQKLQELHPELRGKSYKARHDHTTKVKEEIKSIK